jgi:hypothetical protein
VIGLDISQTLKKNQQEISKFQVHRPSTRITTHTPTRDSNHLAIQSGQGPAVSFSSFANAGPLVLQKDAEAEVEEERRPFDSVSVQSIDNGTGTGNADDPTESLAGTHRSRSQNLQVLSMGVVHDLSTHRTA